MSGPLRNPLGSGRARWGLALFFGALLLSPAKLLGSSNSCPAFRRDNALASNGSGLWSSQATFTWAARYFTQGSTGDEIAGFGQTVNFGINVGEDFVDRHRK
jgi:hypothetical protein